MRTPPGNLGGVFVSGVRGGRWLLGHAGRTSLEIPMALSNRITLLRDGAAWLDRAGNPPLPPCWP